MFPVCFVGPFHPGVFATDLADGPELILLHIALDDQLEHSGHEVFKEEVAGLDHFR